VEAVAERAPNNLQHGKRATKGKESALVESRKKMRDWMRLISGGVRGAMMKLRRLLPGTASVRSASVSTARSAAAGARAFHVVHSSGAKTWFSQSTRRPRRAPPASPLRRWWHYWQPFMRPSLVLRRVSVSERGEAFITGSYANRQGRRAYKLYIPASYDGRSLPLLVMLHGCKQHADDFALGTAMNAIAEESPCFVLYPNQDFMANASRCWNWYEAAHQQRGRGEPAILAGMTRRIAREYPVDRRRIYVAGLSAGGAMAAVLGATYPDLFAAVGIHSGLPYAVAHDLASALALMKDGTVPLGRGLDDDVPATKRVAPVVPTIVFHGDADTSVHPRNGDHLTAHGLDARAIVERGYVESGHSFTRATYHDVLGQSLLEQWQVHGAGHAWSGGSPRGSYTDPKGPDASRAMMRFFLAHPRRFGRGLLRWWPRRLR
jgi:poly(hydroxyalkanoate) depolymerase family esterase